MDERLEDEPNVWPGGTSDVLNPSHTERYDERMAEGRPSNEETLAALEEVQKLLYIRRVLYMNSNLHFAEDWNNLVGTKDRFPVDISHMTLDSLIETAVHVRNIVGKSSTILRGAYEGLDEGDSFKGIIGEALKAADSMILSLDMEIKKRVDEDSNVEEVANGIISAMEYVETIDRAIELIQSIIGESESIINDVDIDSVIEAISHDLEFHAGNILESSGSGTDVGDDVWCWSVGDELDEVFGTHIRGPYKSNTNPYMSDAVSDNVLTGAEGLESLMQKE